MLFVRFANVLSEDIYNAINNIAKFAEEKNIKAYVVGGFVRDMLLEKENFDLDVVIEGDAIDFAEEFCEWSGCNLKRYKLFKTAKICLNHTLTKEHIEWFKAGSALNTIANAT